MISVLVFNQLGEAGERAGSDDLQKSRWECAILTKTQ
jgi:hypothetical protein